MIFPIDLAGWLVFLVPAAGALLTPVFARINGNLRDFMAVLFGFLTAFIAIDMLLTMVLTPAAYVSTPIRWVAVEGVIEFGVLIDPLSVLLSIIAGGIGSLIILFSVGYMT